MDHKIHPVILTRLYGRHLHTYDDVEVRRIFHKLRLIAIENFNEHFKGIFDHKIQRRLQP